MNIYKTHDGRHYCGGKNLSVILTQGSKSCETGKIEEFSGGDYLKWNSHNNNMGDCSSTGFNLELFLNFRLISSSYDNYCPGIFQVNFEHGIYYDFDITGYYDAKQNYKVHSAERKGNCLYSILQLIPNIYINKLSS